MRLHCLLMLIVPCSILDGSQSVVMETHPSCSLITLFKKKLAEETQNKAECKGLICNCSISFEPHEVIRSYVELEYWLHREAGHFR